MNNWIRATLSVLGVFGGIAALIGIGFWNVWVVFTILFGFLMFGIVAAVKSDLDTQDMLKDWDERMKR